MTFTHLWLIYIGVGALILLIHYYYQRDGREPPSFISFLGLLWFLLIGLILVSLSSRRRW